MEASELINSVNGLSSIHYVNLDSRLLAPSLEHLFGTDALGRDVFLRVCVGAFTTLFIAMMIPSVSAIIGIGIVLFSGLRWSGISRVSVRVSDIILSIPTVLWAIVALSVLGGGILNASLVLIIVSWPFWFRLANTLIETELTKEYIDSAKALGGSDFYILRKHVLPNITPFLKQQLPIQAASAVMAFAGLSFIGLGAPPEIPEWGRMIYEGKDYVESWWVAGFPGLALVATVLLLTKCANSVDPIQRG